ncbi:hypothetical protein TRIUR3_19761 [Triticum urartu]|uniref:Uncharacterized protein n=1 Tax=Triticum urartu TaxID=4572 RepID=M7YP79_TRIUA|nr:hypothetical protein TRIUR3_19761 [Triticum urartu]
MGDAAYEQAGVFGSKRKRRRKQHYVYLVFDDWSYRYSIHKLVLLVKFIVKLKTREARAHYIMELKKYHFCQHQNGRHGRHLRLRHGKAYVGKTLALPFSGRGHFDRHLDAFVGLFKDPDTLGQVYSCCLSSSSTGHGLEWKLGKEKLFSQDPAERHVGATLVYMGRSKFCLVQCVSIEGESDGQELKEEGAQKRSSRKREMWADQFAVLRTEVLIRSSWKRDIYLVAVCIV